MAIASTWHPPSQAAKNRSSHLFGSVGPPFQFPYLLTPPHTQFKSRNQSVVPAHVSINASINVCTYVCTYVCASVCASVCGMPVRLWLQAFQACGMAGNVCVCACVHVRTSLRAKQLLECSDQMQPQSLLANSLRLIRASFRLGR